MKKRIKRQLKKARGFGSLEIIQRLPKKARRRCDTLELQLKAIRATMDRKRMDMREEYVVLLLTDQKELIAGVSLYKGTVDGITTDFVDILQLAVIARAYYIVTAHNHPDGHPQPSEADVDNASRLSHMLRFCQLELLDSIVVTRKKHCSLYEMGLLRT